MKEEWMPTEVVMPQMGESIFEGTITKWLKKPGEAVEKDEPLLEISTDKVDAEIASPAAGVLTEIRVQEGSTVHINAVIAVIGESNGAARSSQPAAQPKATASAAPVQGSAAVEVVMPQMGESIFEGTITKWLKQPGERVEIDEPLFEISTDKVDAEIPSPAAGILTEIKAQEGATVHINTVVALIGGPAGEAKVGGATTGEAKTGAGSTAGDSAHEAAGDAAPKPQQQQPAGAAQREADSATWQAAAAPSTESLRSSPLVRRMAKEHGVDLGRVQGTGLGGRITKEDMQRHLSAPPAERHAAAARPSVAGAPQPLSKMRAIIAQRMVESLQISPHAHTVYRIDMTRIARLRERERAAFEQRHGVKLTYMPFIAAAAVRALTKHPIVNASLIDGAVHYHEHVHLGIAVALEWGLIVPVIREAERRSFADLARTINDLAARARSKKLNPDEASGSTFTLTNSGLFGGEFGTPIINQPESAILAIGGLRKEPAVLTDAEGNDTIAIRSMQYYCLGFDHRTIDGADSGKFMLEFKDALENWNQPLG
jgi:2-oxoglutarate dehydrogenase E2 component (dihydrolipoamide succinyltransferase)